MVLHVADRFCQFCSAVIRKVNTCFRLFSQQFSRKCKKKISRKCGKRMFFPDSTLKERSCFYELDEFCYGAKWSCEHFQLRRDFLTWPPFYKNTILIFLQFAAPLGTYSKFVHRTFAKYSLERKEKPQPELRALLAIVFLLANLRDMAMRRIFWRFCRNWFLMSPLH